MTIYHVLFVTLIVALFIAGVFYCDKETPKLIGHITDPTLLKPGMLVWIAYKQFGFIEEYEITSFPYIYNFDSSFNTFSNFKDSTLFIDTKKFNTIMEDFFYDSISLRDAGVLSNNYNTHRLFDNKEAALEYLES